MSCGWRYRLLPRNSFKLSVTFGTSPLQRVQKPVTPIDPFGYLGKFAEEKILRYRMVRITPDIDQLTLLYRREHAAGIETIVRTYAVKNAINSGAGIHVLFLVFFQLHNNSAPGVAQHLGQVETNINRNFSLFQAKAFGSRKNCV